MMVEINRGEKAVIIPHSMGVLYFLHFMKWVEAPAPMGGGGGSDWCAKHIKAVMNIGGLLLGAPKALVGLFSAEAKDIAFARGIAPGLDIFCHTFHILEDVHPQLPSPNQTIHEMPVGKIGVYTNFFEYPNFRLTLSTFLVNVLRHYRINLSQVSVIAATKVSQFEIL
ncbi:phospholipid:diacylglycerol acyltransferase 1-like protein [Tanacetum coccineum]